MHNRTGGQYREVHFTFAGKYRTSTRYASTPICRVSSGLCCVLVWKADRAPVVVERGFVLHAVVDLRAAYTMSTPDIVQHMRSTTELGADHEAETVLLGLVVPYATSVTNIA